MGLGNLGSLEDLSLKFGIRLVQEEGIGDGDGDGYGKSAVSIG